MLFWQRVIGYAQKFMPACDFQALIEGASITSDKLKDNTPQNRRLDIIINTPNNPEININQIIINIDIDIDSDDDIFDDEPSEIISSCENLIHSGLGSDYGMYTRSRLKGVCDSSYGGGGWIYFETLTDTRYEMLEKLKEHQQASILRCFIL
jgi:hypothetical protein